MKEPRRLHLTDLIVTAEELYQLELGSIVARRQTKEIVGVRRLVMFAARAWLGMSFPHIARVMDRDHTTIIYHVEEMRRVIERDSSRLQDVRELVAAAMIRADAGRLSPRVFAARMKAFFEDEDFRRRPVAAELEAQHQ